MRFCTLVSAALILTTFPAVAQESPLPDLFSDVIDVRVVNVEAVVTDKKGNRIRGLEASDFELLVDGKPTPIDYFTEIDDGRAQASSEGGAASRVEAVPALHADEPVRTNYLIFIDEFLAVTRDRDRVLKRLERDLAQLDPADRVAVVAFNGENVTSLTDWTNARDQLRDALRQARERNAGGMMRRANLAQTSQLVSASTGGIGRALSTHLLSQRCREIHRSVLAATAAVRSFVDPPGRKVMLVLADGWEAPSWTSTNLLSQPVGIESLYGPLVHAANLVGYTLYPVDLPGFRPAFGRSDARIADVSVGYNAPGRAGGATTTTGALLLDQETSLQPYQNASGAPPAWNREWAQEAALTFLAHQTGGLAMINASRDTALARTSADTRYYYWLGFEPARMQDDEVHAIRVRLVGRPDLRVRSRRNFLDMSRATEVTMLVEGSLLFGGAPGKESLAVRFGAPQSRRGRKMEVPMEVSIPLDDVELLPMGDQWMNELELRVTVINEHGERSETPIERVSIAGPTEPQPGDVFVYETNLLLRNREHRYVAAVYDPLTGAILSASGTVGPK